jgi:hypothetical protein
VLGDDTGTVKGYLSDSEHLVEGKTIVLFGAEASVIK